MKVLKKYKFPGTYFDFRREESSRRYSTVTIFLSLFLMEGCGVKGRPLPPVEPPPIQDSESPFAAEVVKPAPEPVRSPIRSAPTAKPSRQNEVETKNSNKALNAEPAKAKSKTKVKK